MASFKEEFDTMVNSYGVPNAYGTIATENYVFDDYEKSLFLTMAWETLVVALYNGTTGDSFERTEELRRYLVSLLRYKDIPPSLNAELIDKAISKNPQVFEIPEDVMFVVYEQAKLIYNENGCLSLKIMDVTPVTHDTYAKIKRNPFRGPSERRILRVDISEDSVELISNYTVDTYTIKYLIHPSPIIVDDIPEELSIRGKHNKSDGDVPQALHTKVLEMGVELALKSRNVSLGQQSNSQTNNS